MADIERAILYLVAGFLLGTFIMTRFSALRPAGLQKVGGIQQQYIPEAPPGYIPKGTFAGSPGNYNPNEVLIAKNSEDIFINRET